MLMFINYCFQSSPTVSDITWFL